MPLNFTEQQHRKSRTKKHTGNCPDIYEHVTGRILELLEKGVKPWEPSHFVKTGLPRNFHTGQAYRGINVFMLGMQRYASPYWLTYVQAQTMGGQVRKGEKGSLVIKYGEYAPKDDEAQGEDGEALRRGYVKGYTVFKACQIEGIEFPQPVPVAPLPPSEQCDRARRIVAGMPNPPAIHEGRYAQAFYSLNTDSVDMPARGLHVRAVLLQDALS
jgi:antirestriction protein ArdC